MIWDGTTTAPDDEGPTVQNAWRVLGRRCRAARRAARGEDGQISILLLGLFAISTLLIVTGVSVTSVQLARVQLMDLADAAAVDAADAVRDEDLYQGGQTDGPVLTDQGVRDSAGLYLADRPEPNHVSQWWLGPSTGSADGRTATVELTGDVQIPVVSSVMSAIGQSVTVTVRSQARSDIAP